MLGAVDQARIGEQITHLQVQRVEHVLVVAAAEGLEPGRAVTLFEDPELAPLAAARAVGVVPPSCGRSGSRHAPARRGLVVQGPLSLAEQAITAGDHVACCLPG